VVEIPSPSTCIPQNNAQNQASSDNAGFASTDHLTLNLTESLCRLLSHLEPVTVRVLLFIFLVLAIEAKEPMAKRSIDIQGTEGAYTKERWKADWPGCPFEDGISEGHVSVIKTVGETRLRVNYAPGKIGPEEGGCGWRFPIGKQELAELRYCLKFSKDFQWVKGGKLPGLCGGPENVSGGRPSDGANGFSARLMWRADGKGEAYVYHMDQQDRYGDSFIFPADFRFPRDQPIYVRMRVEMNDPGKKNGKLYVWISLKERGKEQLVVQRTDLSWRKAATFGVDSLYFETFHGGSDTSWSPLQPCHAEFGEFRVDTKSN
jgi:hypothetical protein